jgi:hypothetical protein
MSRKSVRLLDENNAFLYWTNPIDAEMKHASGAWEKVYRTVAGSMQEELFGYRKRTFHQGSNTPTPCAITARESQAAVGAGRTSLIEDGILQADEMERDAAESKIQAWPSSSDNPRAVTICAGKLKQPEGHTPTKIDPRAIFSFA